MRVGFVVNPVAGMGGTVGLKGTDGEETLREAVARGAQRTSARKAAIALSAVRELAGLEFLTVSGEMGADELASIGIPHRIVHSVEDGRPSTGKDTEDAVRRLLENAAEIILFAGGDGTAIDVLASADRKVPILGIPTGVKMESAVFANSPEDVPHLLSLFRDVGTTREAEVLDVDEEGFRQGVVRTRLFGVALVPDDTAHLQSSKESYHAGGADDEASEIGQYMADSMEGGVAYILGPGSTVAKVAEHLGQRKTLLGVDVFLNRVAVLTDASEKDLLGFLDKHPHASVIVSPIGAQGFFFGRGNQQISAEVLRKVGVKNVIVLATPTKLAGTPVLRVDTGEPSLDKMFKGRMKVVTGYQRRRLVPVL